MQIVNFTCPSCGQQSTVEEVTSCDGITSEIVGLDEKGSVQYGDSIGHGDVYDVTFRCQDCGAEIDADSREDLVALGHVTLGGLVDPIIEEGLCETERGNNYLVRGMSHLAYYKVGDGIWLEVSICPENYPATQVQTVKMTDADLLAHCKKAVEDDGWEWVKNNLE